MKVKHIKRNIKYISHLEDQVGNFYGNIGKLTKITDDNGTPLYIGDTVNLFRVETLEFVGERSICYSEKKKKAFVIGIEAHCNDITGEILDCWKIIKNRSYIDISDQERVGDIKYIKNDIKVK